MGWGTGNIGNGSGGLNFKIVGGTSEPSNPHENTIWVNTDQKITSWIFSANEPENPDSGTVWISTGSYSPVAFNALKKNGIIVYPISAKQHLDGVWVDKTAKTYQGGALVDWLVYLYKDGDEFLALTGGWETVTTSSKGTVTKNADSIDFVLESTTSRVVFANTKNAIDLTNISTLEFDLNIVSGSGSGQVFVATRTIAPTDFDTANNDLSAVVWIDPDDYLGENTFAVDVSSLSGMYYVFCAGKSKSGSAGEVRFKLKEIRTIW